MPERLRRHLRQPVRFILTGVANTLSGLAVIYFLKWAFDFHDMAANVVGYSTGLAVSLVLNSRWTFSYAGRLGRVATRFALVVAVAYAANALVVGWAIYRADIDPYIGQALGVVPYALISYFGFKVFVFRDK